MSCTKMEKFTELTLRMGAFVSVLLVKSLKRDYNNIYPIKLARLPGYKHWDKKPEISLVILAPSKDKKALENVEYSKKISKQLINIKASLFKKKKIESEAKIENEIQLRERTAKL